MLTSSPRPAFASLLPPGTTMAAAVAAAIEPLLIDAAEFGRLIGLSERTVRRLDSAAKIPRSLACGGSKRWRLSEARAWVEAGCPDRRAWEKLRAAEPR